MNWQLILLHESDQAPQDLVHGFTIGRSERNHWSIEDDSISRVHARFDEVGNRYFVRDLHSSNGVYLNGERVREMEIFPGDRLQLGEKVFQVSGGAQTELVVVNEDGPTLEPRLPEEGWRPAGWRTLARQLLESLDFLKPSSSLLGVQTISDKIINEIITSDKPIDISSWILEEIKRGPLLLNNEDTISGRESLLTRQITSIMVFPLGYGAFVYLEKSTGQWSEKEFFKAKELLEEFKGVFVSSLESWVNRESLRALISKDPAFKKILNQARRAAAQNVNVVIEGAAGTGKTLLAKWIHEWSPRNDEKLVSLDLSLVPLELVNSTLLGHEKGAFTGADQQREGYLNMAHRGTLLLKNFDESPAEVQTLLLKILEDGEYTRVGGTEKLPLDLRLIVTSRKNLKKLSQKEGFREDLYYRLAVLEIEMPPLDLRVSDIEMLVRTLLDELAANQGRRDISYDKNFMSHCQKRLWPGNVRELKNFLERALVESSNSDCLSWSEPIDRDNHFLTLKELEKTHILAALERCNWSKGQACDILGITRPTLAKKIADYNLEKAN